jgi:hypothetical protein
MPFCKEKLKIIAKGIQMVLEVPDIPSRTDALLSNMYITEHDVKDISQTLKIGKACGDDGITHQMLKSTSETICIPLAIIFNYLIKIWVYNLKDCFCRLF